MSKFLFALFIFIPLIEIYFLIEVGSIIGGLPAIGLCLLTAAIGGILVRTQGLKTLLNAQKQLAHGTMPAEAGMHGAMLIIAGVLLFTPGFFTDTAGFALLIPALRGLIIRRLMPTLNARARHTYIDATVIRDHDPRLP
jgi:UPF0716 protein FxsA